MMVSAIRRHPRRRRAPLPRQRPARPPPLSKSRVRRGCGGTGARSGRWGAWGVGMAEAAVPQRPAATGGERGQVGSRFPPGSRARPGEAGWERCVLGVVVVQPGAWGCRRPGPPPPSRPLGCVSPPSAARPWSSPGCESPSTPALPSSEARCCCSGAGRPPHKGSVSDFLGDARVSFPLRSLPWGCVEELGTFSSTRSLQDLGRPDC